MAYENDAEMLKALGDDAHKWAVEFCEHFPSVDVEAAHAWFANAMMTMWDVTNSRITHSDEALADHISALVRNRDFWRELGADARITPSRVEEA